MARDGVLRTGFTVSGVFMAQLALDDSERMFDLGADHGDQTVDLRIDRMEIAALGGPCEWRPRLRFPHDAGRPQFVCPGLIP